MFIFILCTNDLCADITLEGGLADRVENCLEVGTSQQIPESWKLHEKENAVIIAKLRSGERPLCSFQC